MSPFPFIYMVFMGINKFGLIWNRLYLMVLFWKYCTVFKAFILSLSYLILFSFVLSFFLLSFVFWNFTTNHPDLVWSFLFVFLLILSSSHRPLHWCSHLSFSVRDAVLLSLRKFILHDFHQTLPPELYPSFHEVFGELWLCPDVCSFT